jgi:nicotinate dehydrogenase subunit B
MARQNSIAAEAEIDRRSGKVWARKFTVAHDWGLIINLDGLRRCIEGNVVQGTSRALPEEVAFDRAKVTSIDWTSYPILDITEAPEAVDIVLINRPELPPAGAGESSIRRSPRPSPTPSSTPPACACAALR